MELPVDLAKTSIIIVFAGALLFVVGLFQGVAIPRFKNRRMGLSAHLTAVQSGTAIMVFGVVWTFIILPGGWNEIAWVGLIAGNYLIWIGMTVAAVTGASKALPMAGNGFSGSLISERLVTLLEHLGVAASLVSGLLIVIGLGRHLLELA